MLRNVATGLGLAAALILAPRVHAEEGETTEQRLQRLEKRNQELENRVRELEQKEAVVSGDPEALKTEVDEYLAEREEELDGADEGGIGLNIVLRRNNVVATLPQEGRGRAARSGSTQMARYSTAC